MALPVPAPSLNFSQWGFTPAAFSSYDVARNNLSNLKNLSLTGISNVLAADIAGTIDLGTTPYTVEQLRVYEGVPNPGPANANWRRAQAEAMLLLGGSRFGFPMAASTRVEGRPVPINSAELDAL